MKTVFIVVLNYKQPTLTLQCLESIYRLDYPYFHVVVVDNNSEDQSIASFQNWVCGTNLKPDPTTPTKINDIYSFPIKKPTRFQTFSVDLKTNGYKQTNSNQTQKTSNDSITLIQSPENMGYAKGNNIGIKFIETTQSFDYIWILNNDTVVHPDSLKTMISGDTSDDIGLLGSALFFYHPPHQVQTYGRTLNKFLGTVSTVTTKENLADIDYISGASLLIKRSCLEKIGALPTDYFMYYEDVDFSLNARQNGFKIKSVPEAIVYHKEGATTGTNSRSTNTQNEKMDLISLKSRWIFCWKYGLPRIGIYLGFLISMINRLRRRQFGRVFKIVKILFTKPTNSVQ